MDLQPYYLPPDPSAAGKAARRNLARIGTALYVYQVFVVLFTLACSWICSRFFPAVYALPDYGIGASILPQYVLGLPLFWLIVRSMPRKAPQKRRLNGAEWVTFFAGSIALMLIGALYSKFFATVFSALRGRKMTDMVSEQLDQTSPALVFLCVVILAPIVEELIFRKLIMDRLLPYSECLAVITSGLLFGLMHGNFFQLFYAVLVGILFAYVYLRTGRIRYSIAMHMIVNFMGASIIDLFRELIEQASAQWIANGWSLILEAFTLAQYLLAACGLALLIRRLRGMRLSPKGEMGLSVNAQFKAGWLNFGMLLFGVLCVISFVISLFY